MRESDRSKPASDLSAPAALRILVVEDDPLDAELVTRSIKAGGRAFDWRRVDTPEDFNRELAEFRPDVIVSDFRMPHFSGTDALHLAQAGAPDTPFLIVTGSINEETAVECMKAGAADYVLKERLARLPLAIDGALQAQQQRRARRTAEELTHIQAAALQATANGIVITDPAGLVEWVNPAFTVLTGYTLDEVRGRRPPFLTSNFHPPAVYRQIETAMRAGQVWNGEIYSRRKDGSVALEEITLTPVRDREGRVTRFVAVKQDQTARKRQEEEIRELASHDPLTRLPNRAAFQADLAQAVEAARLGAGSALLLLDIDHFRVVNDALGQAVGDRTLVWIGEHLVADLPKGAMVSRFGDDEFGILLPATSIEAAQTVADSLRRRAGAVQIEESGGDRVVLTLSGGLAPIDGSLEPGALVAITETALESARDQGGDRLVLATDEADAVRRRSADIGHWAARLRDSLRLDRLVIHFQPVVDLRTDQVIHREVLVRMVDTDGALIMPGKFLPAAGRLGLLPQLDRWIVDRAFDTLQERPDISLFVNLTGTSLADDHLLRHIEERLAAMGGADGRLAFEITETEAVADLERVRRWIHHLKELGVSFALDDFGTGYSSFAYLRALPVDYVKIDGSFIRDLENSPANHALVQAMTAVAHTLGKQVIAEWVETAATAETLRQLGVEWGQGYHWGKPGPLAPLAPIQALARRSA